MLNRRWKAAAAALLAAAVFTAPAARGISVEVDGAPLTADQGWGSEGTSYITLKALSEQGEYTLTWDGREATLKGEGLEITAAPGQPYIEVNGRALYVREGVGVRDGRAYLPLRVVADATGGSLRWDGDTATAALTLDGAVAPLAAYPEEDLYWLSRIISAESRGEPLLGQIAVGNVVLNRVEHKNYPDNIRDVVFDTRYGVQFEPVENGTVYDDPAEVSILAAKLSLEGAEVVGESIYFFAPALSPGTWIRQNATYLTTIGCHNFYLE